jgi:cytoskeletal protein CcmA (bactofilin family)
MIRMGRNSRTDVSDAPPFQGNTQPAAGVGYQYAEESNMAQTRVVAESESIARDIKEGRLSGFVGHGTSLTGETSFQMMLRIDGHLSGTLTSDGGTLIVGSTGQVDANVSVGVANINGTVQGDIVATERIQLGRTARVVGNIATPKLLIEEGAIFEGSCSMLKAVENKDRMVAELAEQQRAAEQSRYNQYSTSSTSSVEESDDLDAEVEEEEETAEAAVL